jgi:hypothetical protein
VRYIEAPDEYDGIGRALFLAGGISGTEDWQARVIAELGGADLVLLNPRRRNCRFGDPGVAREQIAWEFRHLRRAWGRLFWFPPETLCPIALFELGAWSRTDEPLFVGAHPAYARRLDVEVQSELARPDVRVASSIEGLAGQVLDALGRRSRAQPLGGASCVP